MLFSWFGSQVGL